MPNFEILSVNKLASIIQLSRLQVEEVAHNANRHYSPFVKEQRKSDGRVKQRMIDNPQAPLKTMQARMQKKIFAPFVSSLPKNITGSIKKRGILQNAMPHIRKECVVCLDIKSCFPSITKSMVYSSIRNHLGCSPPVAQLITKLTCFHNHLPQGSPCSSSLCNIVLYDFVNTISIEAKRRNVAVTQYLDDITLSGTYTETTKMIKFVLRTLNSMGLKVSRDKIRVMKGSVQQKITGVVVNKKISVGRKKINSKVLDLKKGIISPISFLGFLSFTKSLNTKQSNYLRRRIKDESQSQDS